MTSDNPPQYKGKTVQLWAVLYQPFGELARVVFRHVEHNECDTQASSLWERAFPGDEITVIAAVFTDGDCNQRYLEALTANSPH